MTSDVKSDFSVSIIIPFIDEINYLTEAVTSALQQDLPDFEIVIVCNNTLMIKEDQKQGVLLNAKIHWLHEPKRGSAYARNKGLSHARGTWIQYLDVDDLLKPEKILSQLNFPESDIVVSPHTYRYINQQEISSSWASQDIWCGLLAGQLGSTSSWLWRRSSIQGVGGWNPEFGSSQEYELLFRLLSTGHSVQPSNDNLTIVRERRSGSITKSIHYKPITGIRLREKIWEFLVSKGWDTPERFTAFRAYLFKNLRGLFITDKELALSIYEKYFSDASFHPQIRIPFYGMLYGALGFQKTEELMSLYRRIRNTYWKGLPYNK